MSQVANVERMPLAAEAPRNETASMMQAVIGMATRPDLDPARVEWAIGMYERLQAQEAKRRYDEAMSTMAPELPTIDERGQITGRNSYAKWDDINRVIKPILSKHGFNLTHRRADIPGEIGITAIVAHRDGHREETTLSAGPDKSGGKNDIQALGSTVSYLQRYTAKLLLNLTSAKGEDDDGRSIGGAARITDEQVTELRELLFSTGANLEGFLKAAKVENLSDILGKNYDALCQAVRQRAAKRNGGNNAA